MTAVRLLILIPHPDDEVVGCAVALARVRAAGASISGLYLTTGVPRRELLSPWRRRRYPALVARRREEAGRAAAALGISACFLDCPARTLKSHLDQAMSLAERMLRDRRIDEIWTPAWEGGHQDHDVANFMASRLSSKARIKEFAEYNLAGGRVHSQTFAQANGNEQVLALTVEEVRFKAELLSIYRSERTNLRHVRLQRESLRPLAPYNYCSPPHPGLLFCERFQWLPFRHPRVDFDRPEGVRAALAAWGAAATPLR